MIEIQTGWVNYAGTDSTISVTVYGLWSSHTFYDLPGSFETGDYDSSYQYVDYDFGEPYQIHPYKDGSGVNPGWYLSWVRISINLIV